VNSDVHTLSGAYALNALNSEDRHRFTEHLESCAACRQEVRELRDVAARLGASEEMAPPADLKARVLAAAREHPQLPPLVPDRERRTQVRGGRRLPWLVAAAAAAVLIVAGAVGYAQWEEWVSPSEQLAAGVARVFEAPDARRLTTRTADGATVSVAASPSLDRMALDTDGLHTLDEDEVYQLWTIHDGAATSAGLLDADQGAAMAMPDEGSAVALTVEPAGGSVQPTSDPIVTVTPSRLVAQ
jgi:anti-sigma-K factor RskA